jgi:HSP20 family protein
MPADRKTVPAALSELLILQREINELIERLTRAWSADGATSGEWAPSVDVFDADGNLNMTIEVPGLTEDSLAVVCREGQIVVSGERRERPNEATGGYLCLERPHGRFSRAIPINGAVDLSGATARLGAGLLWIRLPRRSDRRGQSIEIPVERKANTC